MKKIITTPNAPAPIGPYNQAILVKDTLYISGQTPIDPKTGKRDKEAFEKACEVIFPVGRIFELLLQLQQAARKFLNQWAVLSSSFGKQIRCYYSKPPNRFNKLGTGT